MCRSALWVTAPAFAVSLVFKVANCVTNILIAPGLAALMLQRTGTLMCAQGLCDVLGGGFELVDAQEEEGGGTRRQRPGIEKSGARAKALLVGV